jgi:hypothetical protein
MRIGRVPSILMTFFLASMGWVIFNTNDVGHAMSYYSRMLIPDGLGGNPMTTDAKFWVTGALAVVFSFMGAFGKLEELLVRDNFAIRNPLRLTMSAGICLVILLLCSVDIMMGDFNPFIYFRF